MRGGTMLFSHLTTLNTAALVDLLWLPGRLTIAEEEVAILAELSLRSDLTIIQRSILERKFTAWRRIYNYRVCCCTAEF